MKRMMTDHGIAVVGIVELVEPGVALHVLRLGLLVH